MKHHVSHKGWMTKILLLAVGLACVLPRTVCGQAVDMALVLVIDNSGSIDASESALQLNGYAAAFDSKELVSEMTGGPNGSIAVSVLLFSDTVTRLGGWQIIDGPDSASRFAQMLRSVPYCSTGGTHVAQALEAAVMELSDCPYLAPVSTIDLSGDGPDNEGVAINAANPIELMLAFMGRQMSQWNQQIESNAYRLKNLRNSIAQRGLSINCVAIQDPSLQDYFATYVTCGKNSFTMFASSFRAFQTVIKKKMLREVRQGITTSMERTGHSPRKPDKPAGSAKKPPKPPKEITEPDAAGEAGKTTTSGEAKQDGPPTGNAANTTDPKEGAMARPEPPAKTLKEICLVVRDADTKLPVGAATIMRGEDRRVFEPKANVSLAGQFVVDVEFEQGKPAALVVDSPGYQSATVSPDAAGNSRLEVFLERLPVKYIW